MRLLYLWIEKYIQMEDYNCNLAGNIKFAYDVDRKILEGKNKRYNSEKFFDSLDGEQTSIPVEISAIVGKNGSGKTTILNNIFELIANRHFSNDNDYKINNILVYEVNNKKYIAFEEGYVEEIIIDGFLVYKNGENIKHTDYEICSLHGEEKFDELENLSISFFSTSYMEVCKNEITNTFSFNLTNSYLLNNYLKYDDVFKMIDFSNNILEPLDYWEIHNSLYTNEFLSSKEFFNLRKDIDIGEPAYYNIFLDYASEKNNNPLKLNNVMRFNDKTIEKFCFEMYMDNYKKIYFYDYAVQRICDMLAESILNINFVKDKIIKMINKEIKIQKYNSIIELLEDVLNNLHINKNTFYDEMFEKDKEGYLKKESQIIYERIKDLINASLIFIKDCKPIINDLEIEESKVSLNYYVKISNTEKIIKKEESPLALTKNIEKKEITDYDLAKFLDLINKLNKAQRKYYNVVKNIPLIIQSGGMSAGEKTIISVFSKIYQYKDLIKKNDVKNIIMLFDEMDLCLHPEWKRQFIYLVLKYVKNIFEKDKFDTVHIILCTHEPYVLSDIPRNNTVLIDKDKGIKSYSEYKTLGGNIIDILDTSFFLNEGNKGQYITEIIKKILEDIKNNKSDKLDDYLMIAQLIDEPYIQKNLMQKIVDKIDETNQKEKLIQHYQELIDILKGE